MIVKTVKTSAALLLLCACLLLSGCDNVAVYGGVSVGSSWGGYSGGRGNMNVSVSGRIR